jgi:hypothetical protein
MAPGPRPQPQRHRALCSSRPHGSPFTPTCCEACPLPPSTSAHGCRRPGRLSEPILNIGIATKYPLWFPAACLGHAVTAQPCYYRRCRAFPPASTSTAPCTRTTFWCDPYAPMLYESNGMFIKVTTCSAALKVKGCQSNDHLRGIEAKRSPRSRRKARFGRLNPRLVGSGSVGLELREAASVQCGGSGWRDHSFVSCASSSSNGVSAGGPPQHHRPSPYFDYFFDKCFV